MAGVDDNVVLGVGPEYEARGHAGAVREEDIDLRVLRAPALAGAGDHLLAHQPRVHPAEVVLRHAAGIRELGAEVADNFFHPRERVVGVAHTHVLAHRAVSRGERARVHITIIVGPVAQRKAFEFPDGQCGLHEVDILRPLHAALPVKLCRDGGDGKIQVGPDACRERAEPVAVLEIVERRGGRAVKLRARELELRRRAGEGLHRLVVGEELPRCGRLVPREIKAEEIRPLDFPFAEAGCIQRMIEGGVAGRVERILPTAREKDPEVGRE